MSRTPGLRFDKVVTRVVGRLQAALEDSVPSGTVVLVTISAPIRQPSKTADALEEKIRVLVARRGRARDARSTIHGNHVVIRIAKAKASRARRLRMFVHDPALNAVALLDQEAPAKRSASASRKKG